MYFLHALVAAGLRAVSHPAGTSSRAALCPKPAPRLFLKVSDSKKDCKKLCKELSTQAAP